MRCPLLLEPASPCSKRTKSIYFSAASRTFMVAFTHTSHPTKLPPSAATVNYCCPKNAPIASEVFFFGPSQETTSKVDEGRQELTKQAKKRNPRPSIHMMHDEDSLPLFLLPRSFEISLPVFLNAASRNEHRFHHRIL